MKRMVIHWGSRTERHLQSGNVYQIDRRLERRGASVCLDRSFVQHDAIAGIRSFLLPDQHLWVIFFEGRTAPYPLKCYIHIARISDQGDRVHIEDLYLDVVVKQDGAWSLLDVDEFRVAMARGELTPEQVQAALAGLENACRLVQNHGLEIESHLHRTLAARA